MIPSRECSCYELRYDEKFDIVQNYVEPTNIYLKSMDAVWVRPAKIRSKYQTRSLTAINPETNHGPHAVVKNRSFDDVHVLLQKQHSAHKPNYIDLWFLKPNRSQLREDTYYDHVSYLSDSYRSFYFRAELTD